MRLQRGFEGAAQHGVAAGAESFLPPQSKHSQNIGLAIDARLDPPDEAVAVQDRQHVVAPAALGLGDVHLPEVVESEEVAQQAPVPDQRIQRRDEGDLRRHAAWRLARRQLTLGLVEEVLVFGWDVPHLSPAFDLNRCELALSDQQLALWRPVDRPWSGSEPDLARAGGSQQAVGPVTRKQLVPALLVDRMALGQQVRWEQPLHQVVNAPVPVAA